MFYVTKDDKEISFYTRVFRMGIRSRRKIFIIFFSLTRKQNQKTKTILSIKAMLFDPAPWLKNTKTFALSYKFLNLIWLLERLYKLENICLHQNVNKPIWRISEILSMYLVLKLLHILANYMVFSLTAAKALWPL